MQTQCASNKSSRSTLPLLALFVGFLGLAWPATAHAKVRIPIPVHHGNNIVDLGAIQDQDIPPELQNLRVGFYHSEFGILWVNFWTWGGEFCVYEGNGYETITRQQAALLLGRSEAQLSKPVLYSFPPGLMIIGGLIVVGIVVARS
jgi:hypothetical protein